MPLSPETREAFGRLITREKKARERDNRVLAMLSKVLAMAADMPFPIQVFPRSIRIYIKRWAASICCSLDLIAVPLLGAAGAAIGRSGRRVLVKPGYTESSCLWTICIAPSSDGKSPALSAANNFYVDRQWEELRAWQYAQKQYDDDPENCPEPGPRPQSLLTDTTLEALRYALLSGPTLYTNDELSALCNQMSQYKSGNADKPAWTSFWSHAPVSVARRSGSLDIESPFVAVTGMMVPGSAHQLNYRGHDEDGFVHRMLIACPKPAPMAFTPIGVPDALVDNYKRTMTKLFEPGGTLRVDPKAANMANVWCNQVHYSEVAGKGAPDWLKAKYKKLFANLWRVALVLHELRRVAETDRELLGKECICAFDPGVIDVETIERAIAVINYFKDHIARVQNCLGDEAMDDAEGLYIRFRERGKVTVREFMLNTTYKKAERAKGIFAEWQKRGYGKIAVGKRKDQVVFEFKQ
jgi:hypothetical protein